ncbi:vWA domain-containing protein [Yinghuangia seranimata]|uniref:vWA domain-containing protein n=1 Tax=Yinghuangia seranimata TaxID=408067 RepID=UPI00248AA370|nr:VWA domain-containing protein [Yinghuangia seranimata]MDI2127262.1 VWA domain-containing protein [Yinghuangia seranimata]MDI2132207.1 VWA domain-containing protein [Yinghuangia seranimata]
MALLERHVGFLEALRGAGLPVSLAEGLDAARALTVLDLVDREALRAAYATTLVKRPTHRGTFDTLFDLWFPAAVGDGVATPPAGERAERPLRTGPLTPDPVAEAMRERLFDLLLDGDEAGMRQLVREAVAAYGRSPASAPRQTWSAYAVGSALDARTLMAGLLREVLAGQDRGGLAERTARRALEDRLAVLQQMITAEVRRRLAEDAGAERVAKVAVRPPLEHLDILRATRNDLAELRRAVHPLARRLATRLAVKHKAGRRGRLDFRRTVRASLSTGGVPVRTFHRPRRPHKPELVVLCDVSDSVASFAHFTLLLAYALREQFTKVRVFAFVDNLDEVTGFFAPGVDVGDAMKRMTSEADIVWVTGRTNYGRAFDLFAEKYPDVVGPKTALLILGDARSNYGQLALPTLAKLVEAARRAHWLNPEPRRDWDTGDSAASTYDRVVPMVECRNLAQLAAFVEELA